MSRDRGPEIVTAGAFDRAEAWISYISYRPSCGSFHFFLKTTPYILPYFHLNVAMFGFFSRFLDTFAVSGGRQVEFQNEEERREAIDHIRLMARRKYLGEREARARWVGVRFTKCHNFNHGRHVAPDFCLLLRHGQEALGSQSSNDWTCRSRVHCTGHYG